MGTCDGRYSLWIGGAKPEVLATQEVKTSKSVKRSSPEKVEEDEHQDEFENLLVWIHKLRHPILMAKATGNKKVGLA